MRSISKYRERLILRRYHLLDHGQATFCTILAVTLCGNRHEETGAVRTLAHVFRKKDMREHIGK